MTSPSPEPGPDFDPLAAVDPSLRSGLGLLVRLLSRRRLTIESVLARRWIERLVERVAGRGIPVRRIPRHDGSPDVRVWLVDQRAAQATVRPTAAVLHLHGGGYIGSSQSAMFGVLKKLSAELDVLVVSVDYRLAPETPFPGSLEDNYAALAWLHANAASLNVDAARIAVMGESAGGGHAAALAIAARDRGEYTLACQVLIYPMLDDRTGSVVQMPARSAVGAFIWTADSNVLGWSSLLGMPAGSASPPKGSVPSRVDDLRGLPSAWIGVGSLDLFHDEDVAYAARLKAAGVPTTLEVVPGGYHGFDILVKKAPLSIAFTQSWMSALRSAFQARAR